MIQSYEILRFIYELTYIGSIFFKCSSILEYNMYLEIVEFDIICVLSKPISSILFLKLHTYSVIYG